MSLVSTEWLANNMNDLKILDCSWHMPNVNRDSYEEYLSEHIESAIFFDLEKNSDQNYDLFVFCFLLILFFLQQYNLKLQFDLWNLL